MKKFIVFIVYLVLLLASTYCSFHLILKENIYSEWYEYLCYGICIICSVMLAKIVK